jgi:cephalosporin hydroxylase
VDVALDRGELRDYWLARVAQHTADSYAGVPISKFPEDLRAYEHLLWENRVDVVIELGAWAGGSALWFRDRLRTAVAYGHVGRALVVSVDVDIEVARTNVRAADPTAEGIELLQGDVRDPELPERVARLLPEGCRPLVVEDSLHTYETTRAALEGFHRLVPLGGFFVVEDGCVDVEGLRLAADWPRGVLPAVHDWLRTPAGSGFVVRRELELYGLSCHPEGFLQRMR